MFNSSVLEVVIGITFIYLILSLVCSSAAEAIEMFVRKRASDLAQGIARLLGDDQRKGLFVELYGHPLIQALKVKDDEQPSYIPAHTFSTALLDILSKQAQPLPSGIAQAAAIAPSGVVHPKQMIQALPDSSIKRALTSLLAHVDDELASATQAIEKWYNAAMDRVSGWYKRRTHRVIAVLGLVLACALNLDTVALVSGLYADANLRSALAVQAEDFVHQQPQPDSGAPEERFQKSVQAFRSLGLPIGWNTPPRGSRGERIYWWASKILGVLLTTLAISLGAPFWFDVLNRFIVVRSTIKPREKSPEERSKS